MCGPTSRYQPVKLLHNGNLVRKITHLPMTTPKPSRITMFKRDLLSAQRAMRGHESFAALIDWDEYEQFDKRLSDARADLARKAAKLEANEEKVSLSMELSLRELEMMEEGLNGLDGKGSNGLDGESRLTPYDRNFLGNVHIFAESKRSGNSIPQTLNQLRRKASTSKP
jgi:hypothetical protein